MADLKTLKRLRKQKRAKISKKLWGDAKTIRAQFFARDPSCKLCGSAIEKVDDANLDHIKPLSKGGSRGFRNLQLSHKMCNSRKGNAHETK